MRALRVGIVCPYSFDAPGGVQYHVRDLAAELIARGHDVSVLAPADEDTEVPSFVVPAGKAFAVRYNGSVARLSFGFGAAARVRRWLEAGQFDLIHVHEPASPSLSMLAVWQAKCPVVATFHSSQVRSIAMQVAYPMLKGLLERITGRIAVSEDARRTVVDHLGGDGIIIPNGVETAVFAAAERVPRWEGSPEAPTVAFLGRLDEPRKGLQILTDAIPAVVARFPAARFLIAGRGDKGRDEAMERLTAAGVQNNVEFLGGISDEEKAGLFRSVDAYVAPQTGGESFGIVLVEAAAAGTLVVASDLPAFARVLDDGQAGKLFRNGDSDDLARTLIDALSDRDATAELARIGSRHATRYDWSRVASQILDVYYTVVGPEVTVA